jgi:pimeloyl-ACP methyl ester carboxylesterase
MPDLPAVRGVEHRWVSARGVRFHVAEAGSGDPLVLVHGWPQHWYEWRHLVPRLWGRFRLICPDLRGFGWSDAPEHGYETDELAEDLLALLDALELERVRYLGHDWGCYVGFLVCLAAPERVERFLGAGSPHPWQDPRRVLPELWRFTYQLPLQAPGGWWMITRTGFVREFLRRGCHGPEAFSDDELEAFASVLREPARARATAALYRGILRGSPSILQGRYGKRRLTVPTLLVAGEKDLVCSPRLLDGWQEHADDMRVERIPECGHFIADERPELLADRALEFLA